MRLEIDQAKYTDIVEEYSVLRNNSLFNTLSRRSSFMTSNDLIFLGLKYSVSAITKADSSILWTTNLAGSLGDGFVTLNCDGKHVYTYGKGQLYCLEVFSGQ